MRRIKLILLLITLPLLILGQETDCSKYSPELIDSIKHETQQFELELIERGYLKDHSPQAFIEFYREYAKTGFETVERENRPILDDNLNDLVLGNCKYVLEAGKDLEELMAYQLELAPQMTAFEESLNDSLVDPIRTAEFIGSIMRAEDLEKESVKRRFLLTLVGVVMPEGMSQGIGIQPNGWKVTEVKTPFTANIEINAQNEMFLDKVALDSISIANSVDQLIMKHGNNITFVISAERETSYEAFIDLLDSINKIYTKQYNSLSLKLYGVDFKDLDKDKRKGLTQQLKKNIRIKEPSN